MQSVYRKRSRSSSRSRKYASGYRSSATSYGVGGQAPGVGGIFVATDLGRLMLENPLSALVTRWVGERRVRFPLGRWTRDDLLFLKELMEAGRYRAVVDRAYPLEDVVEATAYVETGQKTGNVVLVVG